MNIPENLSCVYRSYFIIMFRARNCAQWNKLQWLTFVQVNFLHEDNKHSWGTKTCFNFNMINCLTAYTLNK